MREIKTSKITEGVKHCLLRINTTIDEAIVAKFEDALTKEDSQLAVEMTKQGLENFEVAKNQQIAICQDTGMVIVFCTIGQEVRIVDGLISQAIQQGVKEAYKEGYFRKSIVSDPLFKRDNTNDNTPAIIYYEIVEGDGLELDITAKGFGSENMSVIKMLLPTTSSDELKQIVIDVVKEKAINACPPIVVGIGIGGSFEYAAMLAKKATLIDINQYNDNSLYEDLEKDIENSINDLNIGVSGMGGSLSCLKVSILYHPTHIAGLPLAINLCCHVVRHQKVIL